MGSKHRLAPRLAEVFATLPPGPAVDAFSGSGVVAYTLKATGRQVLANDHLAFAAAFAQAMVANDEVAADAGRRRPAVLAEPRRPRLHPAHVRRAVLPRRGPRLPRRGLVAPRRHGRHAARDRDQRAVPRRRAQAAARRVHDHDAALRRRAPPAADEPARAVPRGGRRRQRGGLRRARRAERELCGEVFDLDPAGVAVAYLDPPYAPPARRHVLHQALPLPRGPRDVLARPGDHVGDALAQARQAPHAVRVQEDGRATRWTARSSTSATPPSCVSYGSNAALGVEELESLMRRHTPAVERIEIPHTYAFGTHGTARRRAATEYVLIGSGPKGRPEPAPHRRGHWLEQAAPLMTEAGTAARGRRHAPTSSSSAAATRACGAPGTWPRWRPDARIVVLEADLCGHGPSGRNGGFCHGNWLSLAPLRDRLGAGTGARARPCDRRRAPRRSGAGARSRRSTRGTGAGASCGSSTTEAHDDVGLASARAADELGVGDRLVDLTPAQVRAHCDSPVFRRGVFAPDGATVHPGRLALGLRARLIDRGVVVHEHARVLPRARGGRGRCQHRDRGGRASARGTRCWRRAGRSRGMPVMRGRVLVGSSHLIVTEPVPDVIEELGLGTARRSATPARSCTTPGRRTTGGSRSAGPVGGPRSAVGCAGASRSTPRSPRALHRHLLRWFPMLEGRAIEHAWGGPIDITPSQAAGDRPAPRRPGPRGRGLHRQRRRPGAPRGSDPRPARPRPARPADRAADRRAAGRLDPAGAAALGRGPRRAGRAAQRGGRRGGGEAAVRAGAGRGRGAEEVRDHAGPLNGVGADPGGLCFGACRRW